VQDRLEGCIFQHTFGIEITKICSFLMERESLRISMLVLWSWTSTKKFSQNFKNSNHHSETVEHKDSVIPIRHANFGVLLGRSDSVKRYSNFLVATPGFCDEPEKVCVEAIARDGVFGAEGELSDYDFVIDSRKVIENKNSMHSNERQYVSHGPGTNKINRSTVVNMPGCNASKTSTPFSSNLQIQSLKKSRSYQEKVAISKLAQQELIWWIENLTLQNGRSLIPVHSQTLLQTYASMKGWGAYCQEIRTGGFWTKEEQTFHINVLELLAIKYAILSIQKIRKVCSFHVQLDNRTALS